MNRSLLAFGWLTIALCSGTNGQEMSPAWLPPHAVAATRVNGLPEVGCTHFTAVCGGDYVGVLPHCPGGTDVYDLSVGTGVTIVASVSAGQFSPWQVSITDPLGNVVAINAFLANYTTAIAGVYSIGLVEAEPGPYVLHVRCFPAQRCTPSSNVLCLNNNRFSATAAWRTATGAGAGVAVPLTNDTGYFWFFDPGNVELVTKVLDACVDPFNHYWVFAGGLTYASPSARSSPLTRHPLGRRLELLVLAVLWVLSSMAACTSTAPTADKVERPIPVDTKCGTVEAPKLIHRVSPRYPERVRKEKWEGTVTLQAIIGTDGKVSDITVRSSPGKPLSDLLIEAVKQWQYTPAYCGKSSEPIRVYLAISSTFGLKRQ